MDDKRLRAACRLAITVAIDGEQADPRQPAPAPLRPLLTFSRLSAAAYATIAKVVDDDGTFRARVAEAVPEPTDGDVGRAGWLWLHRPVGWLEDPAWTGAAVEGAPEATTGEGSARLRRQQAAAEARAAKHERAADDAEAARRKAVDQLAGATRQAEEAATERDRLRQRIEVLEAERNRAVRTTKALESDLGETRRNLKAAREATRQAEAELASAKGSDPAVVRRPPPRPRPEPRPPVAPTVVEHLDRAALSTAVGAAAAASADLAQAVARSAAASTDLAKALAAAAVLLAPTTGAGPTPPPLEAGGRVEQGGGRRGGRAGGRGRPRSRVAPSLPPGVFDDTVEAHRHLVGSGQALLVVDGYNLARTAWSGLDPEEERRRTVALLEEVRSRSGGEVVVVFDGDDDAVAPLASRSIRVRFSATGVTADDHIAELVAELDPARAVVVVSSDKAVAADGRRLGAAVLASSEFLAAAGR